MWLICLNTGQRMLGCCTHISCFRVLFLRLGVFWFSIGAKFNTCRVCIPLCLHKDPSAFQQRSCSLLPHQVSFCWKSLGCWKRRKWQRKRRALTVASLMWCLAQPTCSGECQFFSFLLKRDDSCCSTCTGRHQPYVSVFHGWTERRQYKRGGVFLSRGLCSSSANLIHSAVLSNPLPLLQF